MEIQRQPTQDQISDLDHGDVVGKDLEKESNPVLGFMLMNHYNNEHIEFDATELLHLFVLHADTLGRDPDEFHGFQTLSLIGEIRTALDPGSTEKVPTSILTRLHSHRTARLVQLLDNIHAAVRKLFGHVLFEDHEASVLGKLDGHLLKMNLIVRTNARHLKTLGDPKVESHSSFPKEAKKWLTEASALIASALCDAMFKEISPASTNSETALLVSQPTQTISFEKEEVPCPIEAAAPRSLLVNSAMDGEIFLTWVTHDLILPSHEIYTRFGAVHSVQHFRSRKAPFYHEFVTISLVNPDGVTSWLRFERAARLKDHGLRLQSDSFAPLLPGGVTLRETVTFSTSREPLTHNADQLASLTLDSDDEKSTAPRMLLHILAYQVLHSRRTQPRYQLFTTNCRWFARRIFLNLAQWVRTTEVPHTIKWRNKESSFDHISQKLQKEWFGGAHLENDKGGQLSLENSISLSVMLNEQGDISASLALSTQNLASLKVPFGDKTRHDYLFSYALHTHSGFLQNSGQLEEALECANQACIIARTLHPELIVHPANALARCANILDALGRSAEACTLAREGIEILKPLSAVFPSQLATMIQKHAVYLSHADKPSDAVHTLKSAISLHRASYANDGGNNLQTLISSLQFRRRLLQKLGRVEEACTTVAEVVELTRAWFADDSESARPDLAEALHQFGTLCGRADRLQESEDALKEVVDLKRALHDAEPTLGAESLTDALDAYAGSLGRLDHTTKACEALLEALQLTDTSSANNPEPRISRLYQLSQYLYPSDPLEALGYGQQGISIIRELYAANPIKYRDRLGSDLEGYAKLLDEQDLNDAAYKAMDEAVVLARESYAQAPETVPPELPQRLFLLGTFIRNAYGLGPVEAADLIEASSTPHPPKEVHLDEDPHSRSMHAFREAATFLRAISKEMVVDKDDTSTGRYLERIGTSPVDLLNALRRNINIERTKYAADPEVNRDAGDRLVRMLGHYARAQDEFGDKAEADEALREASSIKLELGLNLEGDSP